MRELAAGSRTLAETESSLNDVFESIIKWLWFGKDHNHNHNFTCAGFWAGLDVWQLSNAADLTWQFHHLNRAILQDCLKLPQS